MNYKNIYTEYAPKIKPDQEEEQINNITELGEPKVLNLGARMAAALITSIFVSELLIMLIIESFQIESAWIEVPLDSFLLIILTFPSIYFWVIRPLSNQSNKHKRAEEALKENEKRYRTLFELSYDAIFIVDKLTGKYLDANNSAEILTGRSLHELKKLKTTDLTPINANERLERISGVNEKLKLGEVEYHRPDGSVRTALLSTIPLSSNLVYGVAHDITVQKRLDSELKNSLAITEATFEAIHNGLLVVNYQGEVIKTNSKFAEMWKIPEAILASGSDHKLIECVIAQISDPEAFITKVSELYQNPEAESFDLINLMDGRIFERISKPMFLGDKPIGRVWSFLDITERYISEKKLLDNKAHLQTLIQTIPDMIWLKDPSGIYLSCNKMFERLVGAKETEIVGKTDYDLFSRENAEFFRENDRKAIKEGKPKSNEEWLTFADDGHRVLLDVIKTPMFDSKGTLIGVLGIGHDITERKRIEDALKDSEDKFSKAFLLSPYAISIANAKDGKFIEINDAFVSLSGYSRAEVLGRTAVDLDLWVNVEDRNKVLSALVEGKEVTGKEFEFKKRNGETGTGLYSAQIIHLNNELFVLSSINDITYRKEAEKSIRESEEKYRYMFDNNPQPMWIYDLETLAFLEVNQAAIGHYGYTKEEFLNMTIKDIRPSEDIPILLKDIKQIGISNNRSAEWRHMKRGGELIIVEISAHSVLYKGKEARHVLVNDITQRKNAEKLLHETKETFRLYIENSFDVIFTLDLEGNFVFVSPAWERHFGHSTRDVIGKPFVPFVHPDDVAPLFEYLNHVFITGKSETSPAYRVRHINGNWLIFICNGTPYVDAKGNPQFIGVGHDITDERRKVEEIKQNNEMLSKINSEKDKFFSIISHDLRSPFTSFLGLTQILDEELSLLSLDEINELTHSMKNSATNLFRLLENLLEWARMQQGLIPINPTCIQLSSVIDECLAIANEPANNKGIKLNFDILEEIWVYADLNTLQTVIRNLVSNAMKFTIRGGTIDIFAEVSNDEEVIISVKDTGIGMNPELVANLFRIDVKTSRPGTSGEPSTGLGLMLCKEFIEKNNGQIWVESEFGKGSVFHFSVPIHKRTSLG